MNIQDKEKVKLTVSALYSFIDKGQKKNVFHPNTASRKKATVSLELKKIK